jgi:nitrate reductase gamma subunit
MKYLLAAITYFGYVFVITLYTLKIKKYLSLPVHLRSEVYPEIPGAQGSAETSPYENLDGWTKPHGKNRLRRFWFLFSDYFLLAAYFRRNINYWYFLYPWHIGFITIISFHILSFFGAVALLLGIPVVSGSPSLLGNALYSFSLIMGGISFTSGLVGSVGMLITRLTRTDLRDYATPQNYFTYIFLLAVFFSGLYAWLVVDPSFLEYREFWKGLITLKPIDVEFASGLHIFFFALLLIYLPFTRSLHYITRLFGFLLIRWDDAPNVKGSLLEKKIKEMLDQKVDWKGPHVKTGSTWNELAGESMSQDRK